MKNLSLITLFMRYYLSILDHNLKQSILTVITIIWVYFIASVFLYDRFNKPIKESDFIPPTKSKYEYITKEYQIKNNIFKYDIKAAVKVPQNRFITLKNYKITGMFEVGSQLKVQIIDNINNSYYIGVGRNLNEYLIIEITKKSITMIKKEKAYINDYEVLKNDKSIIKYVINKE